MLTPGCLAVKMHNYEKITRVLGVKMYNYEKTLRCLAVF